jgi:hypothetical protein
MQIPRSKSFEPLAHTIVCLVTCSHVKMVFTNTFYPPGSGGQGQHTEPQGSWEAGKDRMVITSSLWMDRCYHRPLNPQRSLHRRNECSASTPQRTSCIHTTRQQFRWCCSMCLAPVHGTRTGHSQPRLAGRLQQSAAQKARVAPPHENAHRPEHFGE